MGMRKEYKYMTPALFNWILIHRKSILEEYGVERLTPGKTGLGGGEWIPMFASFLNRVSCFLV